jgi:hypothetical protein
MCFVHIQGDCEGFSPFSLELSLVSDAITSESCIKKMSRPTVEEGDA